MRRFMLLGLAVLVLLAGPVAAAAAAPGDVSTTTAAPAEEGGTSPWVLVLIGAGAGAVVGAFTGLARRRRLQGK